MNIKQRISNPLERRRLNLGYSQQDMSRLLGITQSQYSRIEKGETKPNKHLKKLLRKKNFGKIYTVEDIKKIKPSC